MKKLKQYLSRFFIGGLLSLSIFIFSVVPAHAMGWNPQDYVAAAALFLELYEALSKSTTYSDIQANLAECNAMWSSSYKWNHSTEISGDDLWHTMYELNSSGVPCQVVSTTYNSEIRYVIRGTGWVDIPTPTQAGLITVIGAEFDTTGKYFCDGNSYMFYSKYHSTSESVMSISSRFSAEMVLIKAYVDGIEGYLSGISSKIGQINGESLAYHLYHIGNGIWTQVEYIWHFFRDDFPVFSTTLFTKLDSIITALGNISGGTDYSITLSGIDAKLTTLNTTLSGISEKLDHLICQHDYTSMAYLDGNSVSFSGIAGEPLDDLQVTVLPSQDTHGYDSAWPVGGGVNYLPAHNNNESYSDGTPDGVAVIHSEGDGSYSILASGDRESSFTHEFQLSQPVTVVAGSYFALGNGSYIDPSVSVYLAIDGNTKLFEGVSPTSANRVFQIPNGGTVTAIGFYIDAGLGDHAIAFQPMLTILSQDALVWSPYSNPAPINGYPDLTITHNSTQHNVEFPDALGNLYGGVYDLETGLLTVNYYTVNLTSTTSNNLSRDNLAYVSSSTSIYGRSFQISRIRLDFGYSENRLPLAADSSDSVQQHGKFSHGSYIFDWSGGYFHADASSNKLRLYLPYCASWDAVDAYLSAQSRAGTPVQICYPLAEPITYQLSPFSIEVVQGENIFSVDHGTISFGYLDASQLIDLGYTMVMCRKCGEYQPFFNYAALMNKLGDLEQSLSDQRVDLSTDIGHLNESVDSILEWLDNADLATNSTVVEVINNYSIDIDLAIGNFTHILDLFVIAFDFSAFTPDWIGAAQYFNTLGVDPIIPEGGIT